MTNTTDEFYKRVEKLREDLKPLQEYYGLTSKTLEQRAEEYKRKQEILLTATTKKPKWFNNI